MSEIVVIDADKLPEYFRRSLKLVLSEVLEEKNLHSEIMTKMELADYLRCDISKISRYMKKGLPFVRFGSEPRFYRRKIDEWLEEQK